MILDGLMAYPQEVGSFLVTDAAHNTGEHFHFTVGKFLISPLGGSRVQIGGPTGAFVVVIAGIVAKYGLDGLFMCTMMAGVLLVCHGPHRTWLDQVRFIPRPVVIGFTNGIAVLIASTQIRDFFGLRMNTVPSDFFERMEAFAAAFPTLSPASTALGVGTLAVVVLGLRFARRVPGTIVALVLGTAAVALFTPPVETIGTRFGGIPSELQGRSFGI